MSDSLSKWQQLQHILVDLLKLIELNAVDELVQRLPEFTALIDHCMALPQEEKPSPSLVSEIDAGLQTVATFLSLRLQDLSNEKNSAQQSRKLQQIYHP